MFTYFTWTWLRQNLTTILSVRRSCRGDSLDRLHFLSAAALTMTVAAFSWHQPGTGWCQRLLQAFGSSASCWVVCGLNVVAATAAVAVLTMCFFILCSWWARWRRARCRTVGWPFCSSQLKRLWINGLRCQWTAAGAESEPPWPIQPKHSNYHLCACVRVFTSGASDTTQCATHLFYTHS